MAIMHSSYLFKASIFKCFPKESFKINTFSEASQEPFPQKKFKAAFQLSRMQFFGLFYVFWGFSSWNRRLMGRE
jgi:hypothetical protein